MPTTEKVRRSELTGSIDDLINRKRRDKNITEDSNTPFLSIIDFIERFKLLPFGLYPVQKFILKLYYGLPLDGQNKTIRVTSGFSLANSTMMTEVEYLDFLHKSGRCNIGVQDGVMRKELILVLGRRSGKCIREGSLVLTDSGLVPIESLGNPDGPEWQDVSFVVAQEGLSRTSLATKFYNPGLSATKTARTENGFEICGTLTHRVKVLSPDGDIVWKRLEDVLVGDHVGIHRGTRLWPSSDLDVSGLKNGCLVHSSRDRSGQVRGLICDWLRGLTEPIVMSRADLASEIGVDVSELQNPLVRLGQDFGNGFHEMFHDGTGGSKIRWIPTDIPFDNDALQGIHGVDLPDRLNEEWGLLMGLLVGDGTWGSERKIEITGGCEELLSRLSPMFDRMFGHHTVVRKTGRKSTCPNFPWSVRVFSTGLRKFLDRLGYSPSKPADKRVPWSIMRSSRQVVASFLRGFFEADGGMEAGGTTISACTASKVLASEVQLLLLNFGIVSGVRPKWNRKYSRNYWTVRILGHDSRKRFASEIRFITDRKNSVLDSGILKGGHGSSDTESVPLQSRKLRSLVASIPASKNNVPGKSYNPRTRLRTACGNVIKPNSAEDASYSRIDSILGLARESGADPAIVSDLQAVRDADYFWDPVASVEDGEHRVYDLTVPNGESFVAQGMTNHNSTLSAIISAYEIYKLLCRGHPQSYYGVPSGNEIRVLCIANDKEQASIVYSEMQGHIESVDYFKSSLVSATQTFMKFQTEHDKKRFSPGGKGTIVSTFKSSIAKGLRGRGIMCVVLDELAFFVENGNCQSLGGRVSTSSGLLTLGQILDISGHDRLSPGWSPVDLEVIQESGVRAKATRVYYGGRKSVLEVRTRLGYSISMTPEHRVKVMDPSGGIVWKYGKDLALGDYIGINRSPRHWPETLVDCSSNVPPHSSGGRFACRIPNEVDEQLGEFLGILVGDGTWKSGDCHSRIIVTGGCEQFLPVVQFHFRRYFDSFGMDRKPIHPNNTCEVAAWNVRKQNGPFRKFLDNIGYHLDATKSTKSVPWVIFRSPKRVVASFLRGLFETDGGLEASGSSITFSTASKTLAEEVQLLLLDFGIISRITPRIKGRLGRTYFHLRIFGVSSRRTFLNDIDFISERKRSLLREGLVGSRSASDIIPHQHVRLRRILESVPVSCRKKKGEDARTRITRLCSSSSNRNRQSSISYDSANRLLDLGKELGADPDTLSGLAHICSSNYFWDPISSIAASETEVADLHVPDGNAYVAQGMTNHNSGAERIYRAIMPSIAQFSPKDPLNKLDPIGPSDGRVIAISSPDAREGFFYRLYQTSLSGDTASKNMLMIQAPTWEVNTSLHSSYYEVEHSKDPKSFDTEHGANFSDRVRGWIEDHSDLTECIIPDLRPQLRGNPRELYWAGIDFGISNDGTAIALTHLRNGRVELGYHEVWYPKKNWKETNPHLDEPLVPYARTLQDRPRLDLEEIAEWLRILSTRFFIASGVFDQWAGPLFEQTLHKKGLTQLTSRFFSPSEASQVYSTAKMMMYARQLGLYDYPLPEGSALVQGSLLHSPLISELLELQASSGGKNIVVVKAPNTAGKHDDVSDALVRSVMLAAEYMKDHPDALEASIRGPAGVVQERSKFYGYHHYHRARARLHGGPPRDRDPSRSRRIR
jgi:intein/homing endonuclease